MTQDGHFGADVARTYDRDHGGTDPALVARTCDLLAALAEGGPVLEFAIGTGRIALPLAARGLRVAGIEMSRAMVAELRAKETGAPLEIVIGDMTKARVPGTFALVALVFNTIDNLTTQDAQAACFANAARHLAPGGRFVVETRVPPLQTLPFGQTLRAFADGIGTGNDAGDSAGHIGVDEIDVATQAFTSHHLWTDGRATRRLSIPFRYVWPSELDLMARMAGLAPEARWADWTRAPFDRFSTAHVSVWRKPAG